MIIQPKFYKNSQPLNEYPRPQLKRDSYYCLNGEWEYAIFQGNGLKAGYRSLPERFDGTIVVPYSPESPLSKVNRQLKADETLCYRKKFRLPGGFHRGRLLLHFGAVDQVCKVYLNSGKVGSHEGGYTPFTFDITKFYRENRENELVVLVTDDAESEKYGRGKQSYHNGGIWYQAVSGIWQTVWIESVPFNYLEEITLTPDYENHTLKISTRSHEGDKQVMTVKVLDGDFPLASYHLWSDMDEEISVPFCKPWSPDSPELYNLSITMGEDRVMMYFAMRSFSVVQKKYKLFALNGEPFYMNGLLDQGYYGEGVYTPESYYKMYERLWQVKSLGFNMLRKHAKVEPLLYYYYCDILGIVVWQDMVNGGAPYEKLWIYLGPFVKLNLSDKNYKARKRGSASSREQFLVETEETMDALYNQPCVALWTPFNECWGQFDTLLVGRAVKNADPTRWVDQASGWCDKGGGDVDSRHVYFRKLNLKNDKKRVLALTEFGGYSVRKEGEKKFGYAYVDDYKALNEAYERLYIDQVIPALKEGLCASVYTQLNDVEEETNGIFTSDGRFKLDEEDVIKVNARLFAAFDRLWTEKS